MTILLGLLCPLIACTSNAAPTQPGGPLVRTMEDTRSYLGTDRDQLLERLSLPESAVQKGAYGPSVGLDVVYAPAKSSARFYLKDGKVVLAYLSGAAVADTPPSALSAAHPAAAELPSRAGKTFEHHVDAPAGVAWSDDGKEVAFIEVFSSTDLATWRTRFYEDPGEFYK